MIKRMIFITALILIIPATGIFGGVNLKNGNFYISYTDMTLGDQYVYDELVRTYNSKSTFAGLFGYGWGIDLDTYITFYPDGTITLREHGGGSTVRFSTSFYDPSLREQMIDELVDAAISEGDVDNNPSAILSFRERLADVSRRNNYWNRYQKEGVVEYVDTYSNGTEWEAFESGNLKITKTDEGYELANSSLSRHEVYNADGKMIQKKDSGKAVELKYNTAGQLQKLINQDGTEVFFTLNEDGRITEICFKDGRATFEYEGDNLVRSVDAGDNIYTFSYDQKHNLTTIGYEDGTQKSIEYYSSTSFTKKITDPNDEVTEYEYTKFYNEDGTENKDRYGTKVIKERYDGYVTENYYEWWIKTDDRGNRYTYRIIKDVNDIKTTTYYDEICEVPLKIVRGQDSTRFSYNNRCLLTEKIPSWGTPVKMKYHDDFDKIVWVQNADGITTFDYNDDAKLTRAENGDRKIELTYNNEDKITTMQSDSLTLNFTYNAIGKPTVISIKDAGSMKIEYDAYGEITNVSSDEGSNIALQVTQAFQQLLAIVKPSGVNLGL